MAYVIGTANSFNDLLTAVQNACVANGWTLSGNVLSKSACYMQLSVVGNSLQVLGGTGISAGNALTGAASSFRRLVALGSLDPFNFPVSYEVHLHASPDEVYLIVNYGVRFYQWLAFGCSPVSGLPGTGNWFAATAPSAFYSNGAISITPASGYNPWSNLVPAIFWNAGVTSGQSSNGCVHHGLDGSSWSGDSPSTAPVVDGCGQANPLISALPNTWNGETVLLPIVACLPRPSGFVSQVASLGHSRYARIDNYVPGAVITLGSDRWKVYPWYQKNASARNGAVYPQGSDTGTLGWSIRYDGP